ncbi:MAG: hypothetical protein MK098_11165 [Marinovum sp.]|nr:hypothetical protein [Marinovum sp.]
MRPLSAIVLALFGTVAWAETDTHPWSPLFENNEVTKTSNGVELINLPNSILVSRRMENNGWAYSGTDSSGLGAVACLAQIYVEINTMAQTCPNVFTEGENERLSDTLAALAAFYATNDIPPKPEAQFWDEVAQHRVVDAPDVCPTRAGDIAIIQDRARTWLSDDILAQVTKSLSVPRFPVSNPCF